MLNNMPVIALGALSITLIVIAAVLLIAVVALYFVGKKPKRNKLNSRKLYRKTHRQSVYL